MHISRARLRIVSVIPLLLVLAGCAAPTVPMLPIGKPIPPAYLYQAKFLNIHSPDEEGWYLAGATQSGMQFVRHGEEKGELFSAQIATFPLPAFQDANAFVDFIKHSFHRDTDPKRYTTVKSTFRLSKARKYLCVKVSAEIEEKQANKSKKSQDSLKLQSVGLYCRHPLDKLAGFAIIYSHRGKALYPGLKKLANAFIAGVQVPEY